MITQDSSNALKTKVVKGGLWILGFKILSKSLGFVRLVILARLLAPNDFGLLGVAMLAIATLDTFSQTGFGQALIHAQDDVRRYLDTTWTISVIRGLILSLILFFSAPMVAGFFGASNATVIIQVVSISPILAGLKNIGTIYFLKELDFNKQVFLQTAEVIVEFVTVVLLAFLLGNVWALVGGLMAGGVTGLVMSYVLHPYRPRIRIEKERLGVLFDFGKWVLLTNIVVFLATHGDDAFLGKVLGVTALGFYQMAYNISNYPSTEITGVISRVMFPAYAKLQHDPEQLKNVYARTVSLVAMLSFPLAGGIITLAPEFTSLFLGEKWMPIVVPIQILTVSGLFRSIAGTGGALYNAMGRPEYDFRMNLMRLVVIAVFIVPLTGYWGISGTAVSVLLGILAACGYWLLFSTRVLGLSYRRLATAFLPPLTASGFMCVAVFVIKSAGENIEARLFPFTLSIAAGILSYFVIILFIEKLSGYRGLVELKNIFKSTR